MCGAVGLSSSFNRPVGERDSARASRRLVVPTELLLRSSSLLFPGETSQQRQGVHRAEETGRVRALGLYLERYAAVSGSVGGNRENRVLSMGRGSGSRVVTVII
ncbi:hypothetical protein Taro_041436 [Colocasia esculenta]|uniref:Uncharacterized protein n=1 Tax=Colocasia esculenta TaxID=4460 RepID=A0A843WBH8_COLES|nr:hypothetical protein [Colocasia esculenta]